MKNPSDIRVGLLICGLVLLSGCLSENQTNTTASSSTSILRYNETLYCESDDDCVFVIEDCCPCTQYGSYTSISRKFVDSLEREREVRCENRRCGYLISQHISCFSIPACDDNQCIVKPDLLRLCAPSDMRRNCAGKTPTSIPGKSSRFGVSCGYINFLCNQYEAQTTTTLFTSSTTTRMPGLRVIDKIVGLAELNSNDNVGLKGILKTGTEINYPECSDHFFLVDETSYIQMTGDFTEIKVGETIEVLGEYQKGLQCNDHCRCDPRINVKIIEK